MRLVLACAAWLLAGLVPSVGLAAEYKVGPVPDWVVATQPGNPTDRQLSKDSDGVSYLLVDTQIKNRGQSTFFWRNGVKEMGVAQPDLFSQLF